MSSPVYLPDDRALFSLIEAAPRKKQVALCSAMTKLVRGRLLRFPPEVATDVERRADPETDTELLIWLEAVQSGMDCAVSYGHKRRAQGWAQNNGYAEGLDFVIEGREGTCIVAVVGYLLELQDAGVACTVVTNDHRPRPGRAPLGEVCKKLAVPTISPLDFFSTVLKPLIPPPVLPAR
uniref:hypothetical protein n=1 Tax=Paractinoplanes polyasparticus TaxID=2856853 RepID=UPI001C85A401|nr:hypothetical protein [Actinoplanes polyasparticus]